MTTITTIITAPSGALAVALENALAIAALKKTDRPALKHVHVVVANGEVVLEATDSYVAIRQRMPEAKVEGPDGTWLIDREYVAAIVRTLKGAPGGFPATVTLAEWQVTVSHGPNTVHYPVTDEFKFPSFDFFWPKVEEMSGTTEPVGFDLDLLARVVKIRPLVTRQRGSSTVRAACFHLNGPLRTALVRIPEANAEVAIAPVKLCRPDRIAD